MAEFEYNPHAKSVKITYVCPECGTEQQSDYIPVPSPNWESDSHSGSIESDEQTVVCENCGHEFNVSLSTGIYGGSGDVEDVDEIKNVDEDIFDGTEDVGE